MQVFEQRIAQLSNVSGAHYDYEVLRFNQLRYLRQRVAERGSIPWVARSFNSICKVGARQGQWVFATGRLIDLYENELIGAAERLPKVCKEVGSATAQMRLKDANDPTLMPISRSAQRRSDFSRMVGIVIYYSNIAHSSA